ncbi:zinc finger protein [Macleaya cordata]|uniref:Zinc finger protein n=1 Tax=Macleaya cordata TaxID=56857 RepID=A0A200Q8B8_MACCD|nr:zinc finger protein [Macleaya cordata]
MGLSSLPAPSEGVLCIILVNTAISISIFKGIMRSILHIVGIRLSSSPSETVDTPSEPFDFRVTPSETFMEEFRSRIPTIQFGSVFKSTRSDHDCSVCLTQFEPESEINRLSCGHVYHKTCLEKWLDYWNITCPLCRTPLMPQEETPCLW